MTFYEQFELLDLLRDDGVKTFRARELAMDRMVEVHVFANTTAPLSRALLSRIDKLVKSDPSSAQASVVLSRGDYEGTPYLVTLPLDGYANLHEWISAAAHPLPAEGAPEAPIPEPVQASPPVPRVEEAIEEAIEVVKPAASPVPPEAPASPAPAGAGVALGEFALASEADDEVFARLFGATVTSSAPDRPASVPPVAAAAPPTVLPPTPSKPGIRNPPGEFTRMIQTLGSSGPPPSSPGPPPQNVGALGETVPQLGEFTRMLQMPGPVAAKVVPPEANMEQPTEEPAKIIPKPKEAPAPPPSEVGEATRTLQIPVPATPVTPMAAPAAPSPQAPSAQTSPAPAPLQPVSPQPATTLATPASPAPVPGPQAPTPAPQAPGEFTKAIQRASFSAIPPAPASAASPGAPPSSASSPSAPAALQPGAFTRAIQMARSSEQNPNAPQPGEFTRMIQSPGAGPASQPPSPAGAGWNQPGTQPAGMQQPAPGAPFAGSQAGEFTKMWQAPGPGGAPGGPSAGSGIPEKAGAIDLSRYSQSPAGPMPQSPAIQRLQPQAPNIGGKPVGEYTQLFGSPNAPAGPPPAAAAPPPAGQPGAGATNAFAVPQAPAYPQYPPAAGAGYPGYNPYDPYNVYGAPQGPGEFTRKFSAPAPELTLGKEPPKNPPPGGAAPANAYGAPPNAFGAPGAAIPPNPYGAPPALAPPYGAPSAYGAPQSYGAPPVYGATPGASPQSYLPPGMPAPLAPAVPTGGSKLPLILGGAGLVVVVILLILFFLTKK